MLSETVQCMLFDLKSFSVIGVLTCLHRMMEYCAGHQTLYHQGTAFVTTIKDLMQLLLEYRAVMHDSDNRDSMMCCTVNLLASTF